MDPSAGPFPGLEICDRNSGLIDCRLVVGWSCEVWLSYGYQPVTAGRFRSGKGAPSPTSRNHHQDSPGVELLLGLLA